MFLSETKNSDDSVLSSLKHLQYDNKFFVSPQEGGGGGLALFWRKDLEMKVLFSCKNFIDTSINHQNTSSFITFVYGEPDHSKRQEIWNLFGDPAGTREEPWLLTGDFNEILDNTEKLGGPPRTENSFSNFRSFMSKCDLFDLRFSGNYFSWRGMRHNHMVLCRLDRAMSNTEWAASYPAGRSEYLRFEGSDHRPLVTYFDQTRRRGQKLFRFDRSMEGNSEIRDLIKQIWKDYRSETVEEKLRISRGALSTWNKNKHINSQKVIKEARGKLDKALSDLTPDEKCISDTKQILQDAYNAEEAYWMQRSRQMWLALGDKNSGYFHAITKGRRTINKFSVIEDELGHTYHEEKDITRTIVIYFSELFTTK